MTPFWKKKQKDPNHSAGSFINVDLNQIKATCPKCKTVHTGADIWNRFYICPNCRKLEFYQGDGEAGQARLHAQSECKYGREQGQQRQAEAYAEGMKADHRPSFSVGSAASPSCLSSK